MIQNLYKEIYFYRQYAIKDKFGWLIRMNHFTIKTAGFYVFLQIDQYLIQDIFNFT